VRRRFDLRRLPIGLLFAVSFAGLYYLLLNSYGPLLRYDPGGFFLRALIFLPVVLFFAALATLILWYIFRITLPGIVRYRRLQMVRYQRALRRRDRLAEEEQNSGPQE
jgi:hypothetical protein